VNYYPRYPAHYIAKTLHLSMEQDGAYSRLLDWYFVNERPIPSGQKYSISRAQNASEKRSTDAVLSEFFCEENGAFQHDRANHEIALAAPKIAAARANGKRGGRPANNPTGSIDKPTGFITETQSEPRTKAPQSPRDIQEQEQENTDLRSVVASKPATPACPHAEIVELYHATLPQLAKVRDWTAHRQTTLRNAWRGKRERQSLDWWRDYFGYVAQSDFLTGRKTGRGGEAFECNLEWLIRPKNMVKVIEGNYENRGNA
jgi:uncharacterized protein YdaU (DUF1376 family)